jgi:uncharacterized protein
VSAFDSNHGRPRIVYIHGDNVTHWRWGWVDKLQTDLNRAGFATFFELFPDSIDARAEYWLPFLKNQVRAGVDDVLLGWSCGATAAMRYAQDHPVRGLMLVAPYYTDLGLASVRRSGFVTAPWDWRRIRSHANAIAIFHGDDDPWISQDEFDLLVDRLGAERFAINGAAHFAERQEFAELYRYIETTYS